MSKHFTQCFHAVRTQYPLEWASWLGCPNWFDGGLFVNRSVEEHIASKWLK